MSDARQSVEMAAPPAAVYALAQDIARWPAMLPHYRYVRVLEDSGTQRLAVMAARRDWIPVRWVAEERLRPEIPRIEFTHRGGWTTGMEVAWVFEPVANGTRVTITHDLSTLTRPLIRSRWGRQLIAEFFIQPIAGRTLARIKSLVEGRHE